MDLYAEPARRRAIVHARDSGTMAAVNGLSLRTTTGTDSSGFFVALPVYRAGLPHETVEERRANLSGIIGGVFKTATVMETILSTVALPRNVDLYVFPATAGRDAFPAFREPPAQAKRRCSEGRGRRSKTRRIGRGS